MKSKVALVTGSTRGIGKEVARQLVGRGISVIVTGTDGGRARAVAAEIGAAAGKEFDVDDPQSIDALGRYVEEEFRRLDVLINNAAVLLDEGKSIVEVTAEEFEATWRTNVLGPFLVTKRLAKLLQASRRGRVVNVSSGAGQLSSMAGYAPSYSTSKTALNAITVQFAHALKGSGVLVNAVDPGWVRTDMGGTAAPRSVEEGADTIVWLATLPDKGPTGGFFHDRKPIAW